MDRSNPEPDNGFQEASSFTWTPLGGGYRCCMCMKYVNPGSEGFANNGRKRCARVRGCKDWKYHREGLPETHLNCAICSTCAKRLGILW